MSDGASSLPKAPGFSGVFDVDDTETFVRSIAELHDLEVSHPSKSVIRLARAGDGVEAR